ncbi:MAG: DNA primase [Lachnospiraceae bacterium]|nr:DNA primase [Lachnospiraceae bacterium]
MTKEQIEERKEAIKATVTVPDILSRYGVRIKRGRCKAICHDGKNYTAKVSDELYYCFKCSRSMDIFDIEMHFNNCDFRTAFELLGGTEKPSFSAARKAKLAKKERQARINKQKEIDHELRQIRMYIDAYRNIIADEVPLSDLWCYCQNKLQYQLYLLDYYMERGDYPAGT